MVYIIDSQEALLFPRFTCVLFCFYICVVLFLEVNVNVTESMMRLDSDNSEKLMLGYDNIYHV